MTSFPAFQSKRDILSETKYIELVLVADHQEVSERTTATNNRSNFLSVFENLQGALLQTDTNVLLILCFLQFLNYQKNNKTIMYRLLDVANQVDWVSVLREVTPPRKPHPPREELRLVCFSSTAP